MESGQPVQVPASPSSPSFAASPRYLVLAAEVEAMIEAGTLRPGDRVPSLRELSRRHGVSIPTALHAYTVLEDRRLVEARPKSGFYVRARLASETEIPTVSRRTPSPRSLSRFAPLMALVEDVVNPRLVPMGGAIPGAAFLPVEKLARVTGSLARRNSAEILRYDPPPGCLPLRREISRRSDAWGCYLQPDEFVLTNGATEALHLALRAVASPGQTVMVESPVYYGLLHILARLGLRAVAVPSSPRDGLVIDAVRKVLVREKVAALVVSPNFCNPLGSLMPGGNREALLALATARRLPVIEDDIYGDLPHRGERPPCLKALDRDGGIILCGSFSKTLAPGYRAGYVSGGRWHREILEARAALSFGGSSLPCLAIAEVLRDGGYDRHLRRLRATFRDQVLRMRDALAAALPPGSKISDPQGGFVLWIELPRKVDAMRLFQEAREAGISIAPGHLFSPVADYGNYIRISCGHPFNAAMEKAVVTLGKLARKMVGA
ncbi:MAG TPA: PLP-dependent aminotransferase family protein [Candidatus Methylacidiphilales bacterium]